MDKEKLMLATTIDHEFFDGSVAKCTLAMFRLKMLASKNKNLYNLVTKVLAKGTEDVFEQIRVVYASYLCANINEEEVMSEDDFVMMCGSDYAGVAETLQKLINPKKRTASDNRSN